MSKTAANGIYTIRSAKHARTHYFYGLPPTTPWGPTDAHNTLLNYEVEPRGGGGGVGVQN